MNPYLNSEKLLPRSTSDFASKEYWDHFFTQRTAAFEWYGEFHQIAPTIFKYTKQNDKLLVIGCGNSLMSHDLYQSGYTTLISIDISDVVIKQMKKKYPRMDFRKMDATKLEFEDGEIGNILDKGTIDAMLHDDTEQTKQTVVKTLGEVSRCLRFGGRFLCVSLLQDHVVKTILDYFKETDKEDTTWVVRVHRNLECEVKGSTLILPVYTVVCTKMKRLPIGNCVLEIMLGDKPLRFSTVEDICKEIKDQQNYAFMRNYLCRNTLKEEFHTQLYSILDDRERPKYDMFIVDVPEARTQLKMACFLVPEGRETEWLFGTPEGRKITAQQCSAFRVVFVHLNRYFKFKDQKAIQDEVSPAVKQLIPRNFKQGSQIPFVSLGDAAGTRSIIERGHSDLSGEFVVEDVVVGHEIYRRLIFCERQSTVQSEMRVTSEGELDSSYLSNEYYKYMLIALGYFEKPGKSLLLGLGGGRLATFVSKHTQWEIEAVELDEVILQVAKKHFGLPEQVKTHVGDALDFVAESTDSFEIIWLDIDSKDVSQALTCPPEIFFGDAFLENIMKRLQTNGIFVVNLACRDEAKCQEMYLKLKAKFKFLSMLNVSQDINKVLMASNHEQTAFRFDDFRDLLQKSNAENDVDTLDSLMSNVNMGNR